MMHPIDWLIVCIPVMIVLLVALKAQRYVKSVSDFLAAGRVAGRYVVAVASGEAAMGLISLVGLFELYYASGFAVSFWNQISIPLGLIITLTGYCIYRFRETRAFTMGQFFEIRYSKSFRVFSAILQSISGVVNYAIFPAVGARFLIYFCEIPLEIELLGVMVPTFGLVMAIFLSVAVAIVCLGGQITIMVTDCIQGIISYPLYAVVVIYLLMEYSWYEDMAPTLLKTEPGKSMLNPFDTEKLRDFNLFYIFVGIFGSIFNRMSWSGAQGYNAAAISAHEQKMGAVLGTWRSGFSGMMIILLAATAFTFLNHPQYRSPSDAAKEELVMKTLHDVAPGAEFEIARTQVQQYIESQHEVGAPVKDGVATNEGSKDVAEYASPKEALKEYAENALGESDKSTAQTFSAIYGQMRVPMALKHMLPVGILGAFCAICIFLLISTDTTYIHSWGSIIVQDIIVPCRKNPMSPKEQLNLLRLSIAGVAAFAFFFSLFFAQVDFILMFFAITGAIWLGGAGPCIVGGMYWSRGTSAGAFAALIFGSTVSVMGIIFQKKWVDAIYPWLEEQRYVEITNHILMSLSAPFEPLIVWRVTPDQFPINSQEMYFLTMLISVSLYAVVSLLTGKEKFNMDKMFHRGEYHLEGETAVEKVEWRLKNIWSKMLGIDSQYSKGDKCLAASVFIWSLGWGMGSFLVILLWNMFAPWSNEAWVHWFCISNLWVPGVVALVSSIWFSIGGIMGLKELFHRLDHKVDDVMDDGRVVVSDKES